MTDLGERPTTTVEVDGTLVSVGTEELSVSLTNSTVIGTEPRSVLLQEPTPDHSASNIVTLTPSPAAGLVLVSFLSDGAPAFDAAVAGLTLCVPGISLPGCTPTLIETGAYQDLSALLRARPDLTVLVASDVAETATSGCAIAARRRRSTS
jgi:hypothetical protein